jgi:hypothetical protein
LSIALAILTDYSDLTWVINVEIIYYALSGCDRALASKLAWPNSTNMRSVPVEMRLRWVAINKWPALQAGVGLLPVRWNRSSNSVKFVA